MNILLFRLSERNVVEIVSKLVELNLIEIIYTLDGKEYLTPQELVKEIRDELIVHGGRINLVELQQILNVDFRHIETKVGEMVKSDPGLVLVLGQIIDRYSNYELSFDSFTLNCQCILYRYIALYESIFSIHTYRRTGTKTL